MNLCRAFLLALSALFVLPQIAAAAEVPTVRLNGQIREGPRAVLAGSMSKRVLTGQDLGQVPANQVIHGVTLVFRRSAAQQADLERLLSAQQDPASPTFHRWLTPESFGQRFGMAEADLRTAEAWLRGQGFVIEGVSRAHDRLSFSGTAGQVATAFRTSLHRYEIGGEIHTSPASELSLPADLAPVVAAVLHLSDFRPRPAVHLSARPAFTTGANGTHFLTPPDLKVLYDFPEELSNSPYFGEGQGIAIVGQSYIDLGLSSIVREFNPPTRTLSLAPVLVPGTGVPAKSPEDALESEIDVEYAVGLVFPANILFVYTGSDPHFSVFDALSYTIDQRIAPVVSISYSECETLLTPDDVDQGNALFQQAAAQGQTLVAASGDSGSTACVGYPTSDHLSATQQQALAVSFPASSPYVTAVGGTQMSPGTFAAGDTTYWAPPDLPDHDIFGSLRSYVPETAWNEDSAAHGIFAGGGGASALIARPAWQTGVAGLPAGDTRLLPDIALQASSANPGFLFCSDVPLFGGTLGCDYGFTPAQTYTTAGGTSFAAPTFAAMVALLNWNTRSLGQGNLNPILYQLAGSSGTATSVFHDIASGTIACPAGTPRCSAAGQSGFAASPGYDQATGLGSIDYLQLQAAWPVQAAATQATSVSIGNFYEYGGFEPGTEDPLSISVSSQYVLGREFTPPTGTISLSVDGVIVAPSLPLPTSTFLDSTGLITYKFTSSDPGYHLITATYSGDSTHGVSSTTASILVGSVLASGNISLLAPNISLPANGSTQTNVTVTPSGGYNGRLTWSLSLEGSTDTSQVFCYSIPSPLVQGVISVPLQIGIGNACSAAPVCAKQVDSRGLGGSLQPGLAQKLALRPSARRSLPRRLDADRAATPPAGSPLPVCGSRPRFAVRLRGISTECTFNHPTRTRDQRARGTPEHNLLRHSDGP